MKEKEKEIDSDIAEMLESVESKEISKAVIARLPRYYRYLQDLLEEGTERISSNELSKRMQVTASQIRQDLNNFGGFGQQRKTMQTRKTIINIIMLLFYHIFSQCQSFIHLLYFPYLSNSHANQNNLSAKS